MCGACVPGCPDLVVWSLVVDLSSYLSVLLLLVGAEVCQNSRDKISWLSVGLSCANSLISSGCDSKATFCQAFLDAAALERFIKHVLMVKKVRGKSMAICGTSISWPGSFAAFGMGVGPKWYKCHLRLGLGASGCVGGWPAEDSIIRAMPPAQRTGVQVLPARHHAGNYAGTEPVAGFAPAGAVEQLSAVRRCGPGYARAAGPVFDLRAATGACARVCRRCFSRRVEFGARAVGHARAEPS